MRLLRFLASRSLTKSFWIMLVSTFLSFLMFAVRSVYRDVTFKEAIKFSGRRR